MHHKTGILLLAHGSRDEQWRQPFLEIQNEVSHLHGGPVSLSFLEHMKPAFADCVIELANRGVTTIRVVPLFLATGGHIRSCVPQLVSQAQIAHPELSFQTLPPLGESRALISAFAHFAISATVNAENPPSPIHKQND